MSIYEIPVTTIDGKSTTLAEYRGKVLLIVNVASKCALTPQYAGLEALYRKHQDEGLVILGFPCDQFAHQEPGSETEIRQFCSTKYNVSFPMFAKVDVNGGQSHPLYQYLKREKRGLMWRTAVLWNFTKFLVDRSGNVVGRYSPVKSPSSLERMIVYFLAKPMEPTGTVDAA